MAPLANWKADLDQIISDFGHVLIWGGLEIPCIASDAQFEYLIEPEGDYTPQMKDVVATLSRFTGTVPGPKDVVGLKDTATDTQVKYHIETVDKDAKSDSIRMTVKRI